VFHSIPVLPHFLGPSWWHILKQSWKVMAIKHLLVLDHSEYKRQQIFRCVDLTTGFI
jgi:hypothetical protein